MKLAILSLALLILGCGNKPLRCADDPAIRVPGQYQCTNSGWIQDDVVVARVSRDQWEAAQGLYNSEVFCEDNKHVLLKYPDGFWKPYEHIDAMRMNPIVMACAPPYPALFLER